MADTLEARELREKLADLERQKLVHAANNHELKAIDQRIVGVCNEIRYANERPYRRNII